MTDAIIFPGRFQPFHLGHRAIVQKLLDEDTDRRVVVVVRDTPINEDNPYTMAQRIAMVQRMFPDEDRVKTVEIDDFTEIVFGRLPGWRCREIAIDDETEQAVWGTKSEVGKIIWIFGNMGAGKTTLANNIRSRLPTAILLDGDEMRETISVGAGFDESERHRHNARVASLAALLRDQGQTVLVSLITPTKEIREAVEDLASPVWVFLTRNNDGQLSGVEFELPSGGGFLQFDNSQCTSDKTFEAVWPYILAELA